MDLASRGEIRSSRTAALSLVLLLSLAIVESGCGGSPSAAVATPPSTKSLTSILISPPLQPSRWIKANSLPPLQSSVTAASRT